MKTYEEEKKELIDITLQYQLIGIELADFEIRSKKVIDKDTLEFKIAITHNISPDGTVKVDVNVNIIDKEELLCSLNSICTFKLGNYYEWLIINKLEEGVLPTQFVNLINGMTISTLRGILFVKLQGTFLETVFLPIIDISMLSH